jgi:acyl-CoA synthetase (AMP-forming)/AMP-acid ligase II
MNISDFFSRHGKYYGNKAAIVFGSKKISFAETVDRVNRLANGLLNLGIKSDDKVVLLANNCSQFLEVFFARYILGVTEVTLNTRLSPKDWVDQINEVGANTLFIAEEFLPALAIIRPELKSVKNLIAISGDQVDTINYETLISSNTPKELDIDVDVSEKKVQRIMYTGGTTGKPKGVLLSRSADFAQMRNMLVDLVPDLTPKDVFLGLQPMYHAVRPFFFPCWIRGATNVIVANFHPEIAFESIEKEKVTVIKTVPTILLRLLGHPEIQSRDLKSIRTVIYGGSPMPVEKLKEAIRIFGPVFVQNYGQSESAMTVCHLGKEDHLLEGGSKQTARLASMGRPYSWVEIKVVDDNGKEVSPGQPGELIVRGDHNMSGYLNNPEETAKALRDGWVYTRDTAVMDEDGYVFLVDRKSEMIISGGENIYPNEVEQVLHQHSSVMEACVFGIPDEKWGEMVTAAVAIKPETMVTEEELIDFCKQRLAKYKIPKKIMFHDSLPKNAIGKILRRELRAPFWRGQDRAVH